MFKHRRTFAIYGGLIAAAAALALEVHAAPTMPDDPATPVMPGSKSNSEADKLAGSYAQFAGSDANALALVTGLRNGTSITLTSMGGTTTFTPATKPMGFGNVNIALALAKTELQQQGITNPTPSEIEAALNGGTITTSTGTKSVVGVLQLRSEGEGWGQIANSMGVRLGEVVSSSKTDKAMARARSVEKPERMERIEKPDKVERPERPERIERPLR